MFNMAYKDFLSERDKVAMQFYGLKFRQLSDEQKFDVKQGIKDSYMQRNSFKESTPRSKEIKINIIEARLNRMAGF